MALFKKNKFNFFKGLYLLLVLAIMDIALIYSFLVPGELGRNYDAIGFFFILNVGFIYVNFDVILNMITIYLMDFINIIGVWVIWLDGFYKV